jgi:plasmid stabilization system protein ParE
MPLAFPVVARFERQEIRRRVFGNYGIYYRVDGDMVLIVQILHAARDIESLLPSGP